ncbi:MULTISPECIES: SRPBCC family protein [Nocardioides]|uniref:SRPBCC family protein n=1 Tax=Nocardioides vastitatis TaxID=2568655 RepID=A0ABW0ZKG2_9ACTN|nr:SRPBCC family protein [Nocardioides sp.]THJ16049.1 carbon monoxide dehydrogenase [Nocardioides sp.]
MKLEHSFHVDEDIDVAWDVLQDVRRMALCMPGAAVDTVDGDDITGTCKVKLGPIALTYRGQATFVERDPAARRMVLEGQGRDGANGRASVTVVATLSPDGTQTRVDLATDLKLTGKPAQFGRGVMADVGDRIIGQFADALAQQLAADRIAPTGADPEVRNSAPGDGADEALDLLSVAGQVAARRTAMVAMPLVSVLLLVLGLRRASRQRSRRREHSSPRLNESSRS